MAGLGNLMYLGQVAVTVEQEMQLSRSGTGQSGCRREGLEASGVISPRPRARAQYLLEVRSLSREPGDIGKLSDLPC